MTLTPLKFLFNTKNQTIPRQSEFLIPSVLRTENTSKMQGLHLQGRELGGPISRDTAILSLRYPISRDTFSRMLAAPPNTVRYPPLVLSFTQAHLCDTPFCNVSRDNCAIPHKTSTKDFCDTIATSIARYAKYRCWASWEESKKQGT